MIWTFCTQFSCPFGSMSCLRLIRSCFWTGNEFPVYIFLLFLPFLLLIHIRVVLFSLMSFVFINFTLISFSFALPSGFPLCLLFCWSSPAPRFALSHCPISVFLSCIILPYRVLFRLPSLCFASYLLYCWVWLALGFFTARRQTGLIWVCISAVIKTFLVFLLLITKHEQ